MDLPSISLAQTEIKAPNMHFSRMFSQAVAYGLPDGWKLVGEGPSPDGRYTVNYAQDGVSPANWRELITVTGFKDLAKAPNASPKGMVEHLAKQKRSLCPERTVAISGGDVMLGPRRANIAVVGCGRLPSDMASMKAGEGEISLHVVIMGDADMFVLTRLQRVSAYEPSAQPITNDVFGRLVKDFLPVGICELNDSQAECQPKLGGKR